MRRSWQLAMLVAGVCGVPELGQALVIDDFRQGAVDWTLSGNYSSSSQTALFDGLDPAHTIGGSRRVYGSTLNTGHLQVVTDPGYFQFDATASWGYFDLTYGSTANPLAANLLADGSDAFLITLPEVTPGLWRGSYQFGLTTPTSGRIFNLASPLYALNGPGDIRIPFSFFSGLDLTNVSSIWIDATRVEPTYRIRIGSITTVPEPTTSVLIVFGLVTGLRIRRR